MKKILLAIFTLIAVLMSSCVMTGVDLYKGNIDISKEVAILDSLRPNYPPDYPEVPEGRSQEEVYNYLFGVIAAQENCLLDWYEYALAREEFDSRLVEILKSEN